MSVKITDTTYSLPNDTNENTMFTSTVVRPRVIFLELDLTNLTQNNTIKEYFRTDGTNYYLKKANTAFTVASDNDITVLGPYYTNSEYRVTLTAGGVEGAARSIAYVLTEVMLD